MNETVASIASGASTLGKLLLLKFDIPLLALMLTLGLQAGLVINFITEVVVNKVVDKLDQLDNRLLSYCGPTESHLYVELVPFQEVGDTYAPIPKLQFPVVLALVLTTIFSLPQLSFILFLSEANFFLAVVKSSVSNQPMFGFHLSPLYTFKIVSPSLGLEVQRGCCQILWRQEGESILSQIGSPQHPC